MRNNENIYINIHFSSLPKLIKTNYLLSNDIFLGNLLLLLLLLPNVPID
jgi:hypothetical protein